MRKTAFSLNKIMKIYIASSWKNQHAVEMLTFLLREQKHNVMSFVENNFGENPDSSKNTKKFDFEKWVNSDKANQSFEYDTTGAMFSDLVIYIAPSGKDAAAECGMAFARGVPIIGLYAKGEDFGLMRKMMSIWCERFTDVLEFIKEIENKNA